MPNKKSDYDPIPWEEVVAEWRKDPEYMKAYEATKPEFDRLERQIDARRARRAKRKALVKRVRGFWASLVMPTKRAKEYGHVQQKKRL